MSHLETVTNLVELLERRVQSSSDRPILTVASDGAGIHAMSAADLWSRARAVAARLQSVAADGARVLVPSPTTLESIVAFWAALCAGAIPVPLPPLRSRHNDRLARVIDACRPAAIFGTRADRKAAASARLGQLEFVDVGEVGDDEAAAWRRPSLDSSSIAFLQYTSGSTGMPKGVIVSHGNLLTNAARMATVFELSPETRSVSWLPLYHDMGLIGGMLQTVYSGYSTVFLTPAAFVERPLRWLETISAQRATVSGGPNFGYELVARALESGEPAAAIDLRWWSVAFSGSEPIRADTLRRFARAAEPYGFRASAVRPCYGLAEATLLVSAGRWREDDGDRSGPSATSIAAASAATPPRVSLGAPLAGLDVLIVDPQTCVPVGDAETGEVWISGDGVAGGYWQEPDATRETFAGRVQDSADGHWLRTGDIGCIRDGELVILDRLKDLIIVRGANYYAHDLEAAIETAHPALRTHGCAAIGVVRDNEERVVVLAEVDRRVAAGHVDSVCSAVQQLIARRFQLTADDVVLLRSGTLPRTSSGKVRRRACRDAYLTGELTIVGRSAPPREIRADAAGESDASRAERVRAGIVRIVADAIGVGPADVPLDEELGSLGADSLRVMQARIAIRSLTGVELSYSDMLGATVDRLAALAGGSLPPAAIEPPRPTDVVEAPLSAGQQALRFLSLLHPEANAYSIVRAMRIRGRLDWAAFAAAVSAVEGRHHALRTTVVTGGEPVQRFNGRIRCEETDASSWDEARLASETAALVGMPYDLVQGPLVTIDVFRLSPSDRVLVFRAHHIAADLWSLAVVLEDLEREYGRAKRNEEPVPAPAVPQYSEYVAGQRAFIDSLAGARQLRGWLDRLKDYAEPLPLPLPAPRTAPPSTAGGTRPFPIDAQTAAALRAIARAQGATLNAVITAAFEILLWRYSGQDRFLIGMLASGRTRAELRSVVGYCVNLVAVRARLHASLPFDALLQETRDEVSGALDGQDVPFSTIVERLHPERPFDRTPLVRVTCVYQPASVVAGRDLGRFVMNQAGGALAFDDLTLESLPIEECATQFDLSLVVTDAADGLIGALHYDAALFDAEAVDELANGLRAILTAVADDPRRPIGAIGLIDVEAYRARAARRNSTARSIDDVACVHELIARQATSAPDAAALVHGTGVWSYRDLARRVEACAARLHSLGVGPETRVAVCIERSPEMVAALLGAMSAGAAYVPLDPAHPRDRIEAILRDASPAVVIASRRTVDRVASAAAPLLFVDELCDATDAPIAPPAVAIDDDNAAYVMYTSGSTGAPKGVVVTHGNLINLFRGMDEKVGCGPTDTLVAVTSVAFDISVVELVWTLARGARVVIADEIQPSPVRRARRRQRGLDVSLFYFAASDSDGATQKYDLLIEGAKLADRNGFAAVWTPERHFHPFGGLYPNPSVTGAAIAALTKRVRIRAGSVVLPLHHPARVAEEWSVVDNLSQGRVGVAFASGWHAQDFALAPEVYAARRQVMVDRIETVRRLWRGERVSVPSVDGREHTIALFPKPVQKELPVWLTAAGSPETFAAAASLSANVLTHLLGQDFDALRDKIAVYTRGLADRGLDRQAFTITLMLHAYVDETLDRTIARALPPFKEYLRSSLDLVARLIETLNLGLDLERMSPADLDDLIAFAAERYMRSSGLFGTPAACLETLDRVAEYGADEVACLIDFGVAPDAALASLERIAALIARFNRECERGGGEAFDTRAALDGATLLQCTPSMAALLFDGDDAGKRLGSVRALMLGGEPVPAALVRRLGINGRCLNMYGPTETTVWSAVQPVQTDDDRVTVGGPIANTELHVLDRDGHPLPDGVAGEVWIGGAGVSRGYWGAPAKTAERFVPDPYSDTPGARAYRTGDVGRQLSDGRIELLGRTDHQLKIRGHRVELGDVEAAVAGAPGVARAAVVKQHDARRGDELVAYVVPHDADRFDLEAVRRRVRAKLPANVVPTIVTVNALPLTPNGKVDRVRLAREPAAVERPRVSMAAASPRTDGERLVRDIWRTVLGREVASIDDNFFDVGGHSLLIAQVHERLQKAVGWSFPLVTLLEHPTIRGIAAFVEQRRAPAPSDTAQRAADQRRALLAHRRFAPAGAPGATV